MYRRNRQKETVMKKKQQTFAGVWFLIRLYWKYRKSTLLFLALFCLLSGILPFASIVFPKYILDELVDNRNVQHIVFAVSALLVCTLFGKTLIDFFHAR
jgi:ABC-type bacteriocin/lantibiotic exporter with double-glycine peptidase domain